MIIAARSKEENRREVERLLIKAKTTWPALMLAERRTLSVRGRTRILVDSISVRGGDSHEGVLLGRRLAMEIRGLVEMLEIMRRSHRGRPMETVNMRWEVRGRRVGVIPRKLRGIRRIKRAEKIVCRGGIFFVVDWEVWLRAVAWKMWDIMWLVFVLVQRIEVTIMGGRRSRIHIERGEVWNRVELCGSKVEKTSLIIGVLRGGAFSTASVLYFMGDKLTKWLVKGAERSFLVVGDFHYGYKGEEKGKSYNRKNVQEGGYCERVGGKVRGEGGGMGEFRDGGGHDKD